MTSEVLVASWSFIHFDCITMVQHFWRNKNLSHNTKFGVMKVVPKKADKRQLKDWRPLTMLSIIYKLLSKLLASRLSPHNHEIISPQKTRFIPRRYILKNIFTAWLTHDWVIKHNILMLFLKLDFKKAFDRVKHQYIFVVLERIGLGAPSWWWKDYLLERSPRSTSMGVS